MTFDFESNTIYETVGKLLQAAQQCKKTRLPKGVRRYNIHFRIYDKKGNLISTYSNFTKEWVRLISKDMYQTQKGSIESICSLHPF